MNIKDITIYLDNSLLFIGEHSEHYTNLSTLTKATSGFFRSVSTGALA